MKKKLNEQKLNKILSNKLKYLKFKNNKKSILWKPLYKNNLLQLDISQKSSN